MMKDMAKKCPEQMMQSENKSMMGKEKPARENTDNRRESL
ncbi:hypothetical protein METP2_02392 [Methanosarcinales archaeon]|nr:hypothetical protein METP2_02392 [Methanosarcinales archaeon]